MSRRRHCLYVLLIVALSLRAQPLPVQWDTTQFFACPTTQPLPSMNVEGVKAVLIDGPEYKGEATRFFAYYALPEGADAGHPVPAMVLVHGGGGTAFAVWVQEWVSRGFAAIALDVTGKMPVPLPGDPLSESYANWALLPGGIHLDWGGYERGLRPVEEQWPYCAVSEVMLAHSYLRSIEGVDTARIGITGNSWGGFLTLLTAAVDTRFKLAAPLYASGFYDELLPLGPQPTAASAAWCKLWDPRYYMPYIRIPLLWYGGATDAAFNFGCVDKTLSLCPTANLYRAARPQVVHTDGSGIEGRPAEVYAFARRMLDGEERTYPQVSIGRLHGHKAELHVQSHGCHLDRVELYYTADDTIPWAQRHWEWQETTGIDGKARLHVTIPPAARCCFFSVFTDDGLAASTPLFPSPSSGKR